MSEPGRPLRADAIRNRDKILAAARDQITAVGPETGMDEIARAAGVAVGTLYRHFPTKTDLVAAVIGEYTVAVADDVEAARARVEAGSPPMVEIVKFLERVVEASTTNHAVKAAARGLGVADHGDRAAEARAAGALSQMITAAQQAGQLHPDITVDDIYLLMSTAPIDQTEAVRNRWFALMLPGLTTNADRAPHRSRIHDRVTP